MPLVNRTRATLRSAEFGFFGVWVNTRTHTPRFCGLFCKAGLLVLLTIFLRPARTNWLIVGILVRSRYVVIGTLGPEVIEAMTRGLNDQMTKFAARMRCELVAS